MLQSHGVTAPNIVKIAGYNILSSNRSGHIADGVALAIKRGIRYEIIDGFNAEFLAVKIQTRTGPIVIATCYLPPRRPYLPYPDVYRVINRQEPVYVIGDFNGNHPAFGYQTDNNVGRALVNMMDQGRLHHLGPNFTTWASFNGRLSSRPDQIFTNGKHHHCHHISPGPVTSSDHLPMILDISCDAIKVPAPTRYVYNRADWAAFTAEVEAITQPIHLDGQTIQSIDTALANWYDVLLNAKNRHIPKVTHRSIPHHQSSHLLQTLTIAAGAAWREGERGGWSPHLYHHLKTLQRQIIAESQRLHHESWSKLMVDLAAKYPVQRDWYRQLRLLMGTTRSAPYLLDQGRKVTCAEEKERLLSTYWRDIWRITPEEDALYNAQYEADLRAQFPQARDDLATRPNIDMTSLNTGLLTTAPIDTDELIGNLKAMRTGKAPGHLGITKADLIHLPRAAMANLVAIGNACLATGHWPSIWKKGIVCFIPKKQNPHLVENQRPITLLEIPGKLIEKSINLRLTEHLELGGHLPPSQYGFRRGRGTGQALALLWERCANAVDQEHCCNLMCRDISKAFDKLWHEGITLRLLQMQTPLPLARLIASFLTDRTASIRVGQHIGQPIPLQSGVPQGSVLSPTLYISYCSDQPVPQLPSHLSSYADDNVLQNVQPSPNRALLAIRTIRSTAAQDDYETDRKISTNHTKEYLLSVARREPAPVVVRGRAYAHAREVTVLGLRLTRCGCHPQITHNKGKANGVLRTLRRFRSMNWRHKLQLYKSLVRPVLEYPAIPLHTATKYGQRRLQGVQNSAIFWITGLRRSDPTRPNIVALHGMLRLQPMNLRLHRLAKRTWDRLATMDPPDPNYEEVRANNALPQVRRPLPGADPRYWWPSSLSIVNGPVPAPIYFA